MAASIKVEAFALTDIRFVKLAKLVGLADGDHARSKLEHVWAHCTFHQVHYLSETDFDLIAKVDGIARAAADSSIDLAVHTERGYRVKGLRGRIEWIKNLRDNAKKGGGQTRAKWQAKRKAKEGPEAGPDEGPITITTSLTTPITQERDNSLLSRAVPAEAIELAVLLAALLEARSKDQPKALSEGNRKETIASWSRTFRLTHTRDGRPWARIRAVLEWSQADSFWSQNVRSAGKLREKFEDLAARMDAAPQRQGHFKVTGNEVYGDGEVDI